MKNYRLTFTDIYGKVIFTTKIQSVSMRGAIRKAKNLQPFSFNCRTITSLESESNLKLDKIEFNY